MVQRISVFPTVRPKRHHICAAITTIQATTAPTTTAMLLSTKSDEEGVVGVAGLVVGGGVAVGPVVPVVVGVGSGALAINTQH